MDIQVSLKIHEAGSVITYGPFLAPIVVCPLEHKTCDILAAERLRLMIFDNRLIIESFHKSNVYSNGNFGRVFYIIQDCLKVIIVAQRDYKIF